MDTTIEVQVWHQLPGSKSYTRIDEIAMNTPQAVRFLWNKLGRVKNPASVLPYVRFFEHHGLEFDPEFVPLIEARRFDAARERLCSGLWLEPDSIFTFKPPKSKRRHL